MTHTRHRALPAVRRALFLAAAAPLATPAASTLAAQRAGDAPAYYAAVLTPVGALPEPAAPPLLGEPAAEPFLGLGLHAGYAYARLSERQALPVHVASAGVELTTLWGRLHVRATGAYLLPDCARVASGATSGNPSGSAPCDTEKTEGHAMAGAVGVMRLATWDVNDAVSTGRATLSIQAEAGVGSPSGARARAAAAGPVVALVGTGAMHRTLRVVAFVAPEATWGSLRVDDPARLARELGPIVTAADSGVERSAVRLMATGGLAVLSTRTGLGLHAAVRQLIVHGATARAAVSVTWRSTR